MSLLPDKMSPITHDVLKQLKYAKACIKESLRLFPVSIGNLRTMQTDVCIGGYRIPEGVRAAFISHVSYYLTIESKIPLLYSIINVNVLRFQDEKI